MQLILQKNVTDFRIFTTKMCEKICKYQKKAVSLHNIIFS